jgi:hypothetical protein
MQQAMNGASEALARRLCHALAEIGDGRRQSRHWVGIGDIERHMIDAAPERIRQAVEVALARGWIATGEYPPASLALTEEGRAADRPRRS